VLTPCSTSSQLIGDFTIANMGARAGEDRFMIWGSSAAAKYHMRWFEKHLPKDASVRIHRFDQTLVGLSIAGPKSQALLQKLVDVDVSSRAFRFMDCREMAVGGAPCLVNRITYTATSLRVLDAAAYQRLVYAAIKVAGENRAGRFRHARAAFNAVEKISIMVPSCGRSTGDRGSMDRFI